MPLVEVGGAFVSGREPGEQGAASGQDALAAGRGIVIRSGSGVQVGDANIQINSFSKLGEPVRRAVLGNIPRAPAAFQSRDELLAVLRSAGPGVSLLRSVTGIRGVGKTQLAAAYARECIADDWRLVAWVNAENQGEMLTGLSEVASYLGIGSLSGESLETIGRLVRSRLEADGEQCLIVFDDVTDLTALLPYIPVAGRAQVVLTSNRSSLASLARLVDVDVFTEKESLTFLAERTGRDDAAGARELARELGYLPLALAQAAAVIARQHLTYPVYLERLRSLPLREYLGRAAGDPYAQGVAQAVQLSISAVQASDLADLSMDLLDLIAVLSPTGVSRIMLHRAGVAGLPSLRAVVAETEVDAALERLADASLLAFAADGDTVMAHRLVTRTVRERQASDGAVADVAAAAVRLLAIAADSIGEPWREREAARETIAHVIALKDSLPLSFGNKDPLVRPLIKLRSWALWCLLELGDSITQAVEVGEPLLSDAEMLLGNDSAETLDTRNSLAVAYRAAGRFDEALRLFEQVMAERIRVLGEAHPDTLRTLSNLAQVYQSVGRTGEALPLLERVLADRLRVLGELAPETLAARNSLAVAYRSAGRSAEALQLFEQVLGDRIRVLGDLHPDALVSRTNLASAYQEAGRLEEAISLFETALADELRVLGGSHPDTLLSRNNLALAYWDVGRLDDAIPLLEQSLAGLESVLGPDHPTTAQVRRNFAEARQVQSPARVFISHHAADQETASRLGMALTAQGLAVLTLKSVLQPGENIVARTADVVRDADVFIALVAEHGLESPWVQQELEMALGVGERGPIVVPVFIGESPSSHRLPYELASRQGINLSVKSARSYDDAARQVKNAVATRRSSRFPGRPFSGGLDGRLTPAQLLDISQLVIDAFGTAGRQLKRAGNSQLLVPGPVWISAEVKPGAVELGRFSDQLPAGTLGYFVHLDDLPRTADMVLDQMRVGGKRVVVVSARAVRAALADGRVGRFLDELEQTYGSRDNLFDTKNALIDDRFLFGRDTILTTIGGALRRDEHILITGLRKVGKTSLLNVLRQHLVDHPVCMVDFQLFDRDGENWPPTLFRMIIEAVDRWGRIDRDWPFESAPLNTATELAGQLRQRFDHLGRDGAARRVIVMLDEIERVFPRSGESVATRHWIRATGALRSLSQGERRYLAVIGADLRPTANRENEIGNGETNPFFSFFHEIPVSMLDQKATGDMLESVARAMGVRSVTVDFIDELFAMTGGHPSLARTIAAEAYRGRRDPERLELGDLRNGKEDLDDSNTIGSFIRSNLWQQMTAAEKQIIIELSRPRRWNRRRGGARLLDSSSEEAYARLQSQGIIAGATVRVGLLKQWARTHADA